MKQIHAYIDDNAKRFQQELFDFLRIPSVSARSEHRRDMQTCASWLETQMQSAGLETRIHATDGHPIVLGEWRGAGERAPTLLIYGHYDVQPAEPLDLWTSPPFEPAVRDGRVYARGSVDDKGQIHLHIKAIEAHTKTNGALPLNVIVIAEGEEEVGSENLMPFIEKHAKRLACDAIVISDSTMVAPGTPTIGASLRGIAYFELRVRGPRSDLHSGSYGGAVINPATALARILATLHDEHWRVAIHGFYDDVLEMADFREQIRSLRYDDATLQQETGVSSLGGEAGFSTPERLWLRPTAEVNGMLSGYTGEGAKTVLPSAATAKVSFRLVPDQDPAKIERIFRDHVQRVTPDGVRVEIITMHGSKPWRARLEGRLVEAAARALEIAWQKPVVYAGEGGSIPIVPEFERVLGAPVLLMGFGLPGENAHAPDEWMSLENYVRGMHASAALMSEIGNG